MGTLPTPPAPVHEFGEIHSTPSPRTHCRQRRQRRAQSTRGGVREDLQRRIQAAYLACNGNVAEDASAAKRGQGEGGGDEQGRGDDGDALLAGSGLREKVPCSNYLPMISRRGGDLLVTARARANSI